MMFEIENFKNPATNELFRWVHLCLRNEIGLNTSPCSHLRSRSVRPNSDANSKGEEKLKVTLAVWLGIQPMSKGWLWLGRTVC
jgi:hypothetical protein